MFRKIKWVIIDVILAAATLLLGWYHVCQAIQAEFSYVFWGKRIGIWNIHIAGIMFFEMLFKGNRLFKKSKD